MSARLCVVRNAAPSNCDLARKTKTKKISANPLNCRLIESSDRYATLFVQPTTHPTVRGDRPMRLLTTLALGSLLVFGSRAQAADLKVGDTAPDFTMVGSDGKTYKLSEL